jgi:hypothetical protein
LGEEFENLNDVPSSGWFWGTLGLAIHLHEMWYPNSEGIPLGDEKEWNRVRTQAKRLKKKEGCPFLLVGSQDIYNVNSFDNWMETTYVPRRERARLANLGYDPTSSYT